MENTFLPNYENQLHEEWSYLEDQSHLQRTRLFDQHPIVPPTITSLDPNYNSNINSSSINFTHFPNASSTFYQSQNFENFTNNNFFLWDENPTSFPYNNIIDNNFKPQNYENNDQFSFNNINFSDESLEVVVAEGFAMARSKAHIIDNNFYGNEFCDENNNNNNNNNNNKWKGELISYDEIKKYFNMPIIMAAKELNVGLTTLKKRCRKLNIKGWPYRKIKSLDTLIANLKEEGCQEMEKLDFLEDYKRTLQFVPELKIDEGTKKLRQHFFKANYKKRKTLPFTHI